MENIKTIEYELNFVVDLCVMLDGALHQKLKHKNQTEHFSDLGVYKTCLDCGRTINRLK